MSVNWIGLSANIRECHYHSHEQWEIVINLSGSGTTLIDGVKYNFSPGTLVCIPPLILHSKHSREGFQDLFMHVDNFSVQNERKALFFNDDEEKSVEALLMMAHRFYHRKEKNAIPVVNALNSAVQQILISWCDKKEVNESVELLKNEIIKNFTNPEFRVSSALMAAAYSKDHIRRCFKNDTSQTPMDYLLSLRINYASDLLTQKNTTGLTISEIAYLAGFYDPHYFSRIFKRKTGLSPEQFASRREQSRAAQSFAVEKSES